MNHGLDEEEIEFKKSIEKESALIRDDIDEDIFAGEDANDLKFDSRDRDTLRMLEKMRSNLVAGAEISCKDIKSASISTVPV